MRERGWAVAGETGDPSLIDGRQVAVVARFRLLQVVEEEFFDDLAVFTGEERLGGRQAKDARRIAPDCLPNRGHEPGANARRRM